MLNAASDVVIMPDPMNAIGVTYANGYEAGEIWRAMIAALRSEMENG